jgi:hypothetical protein
MKTLLLVLLAFFVPTKTIHAPIESNDITVLQINARWNQNKTIDLNGLIGCKVQFAWLESQSDKMKSEIQTVPTIVVYKDSRPVQQWAADLSFSLDIDVNEIQNFIDKIR